MNAKQRREYWLKVERMRLKLERKYIPLVRAALQDQISSFKSAYEQDPQGALSAINMQLWNDKLMEVFYAMHKETYLLFASATYNTLKKETVKFKPMGFNARWTMKVLAWLKTFALQLVSTITGNSRELLLDIVNRTIQESVVEGWSTLETTAEVVRRLGDEKYTYTESRARRIVRTETNRAANKGHMGGAAELPFEVNKVWVSARDERTRGRSNPNGTHKHDQYDHWILDGQEVDLNKPFTSQSTDGVTVSAEQPGDENAPAGFTINCRCRVTFIGKRDQDGRLIMKPEQ